MTDTNQLIKTAYEEGISRAIKEASATISEATGADEDAVKQEILQQLMAEEQAAPVEEAPVEEAPEMPEAAPDAGAAVDETLTPEEVASLSAMLSSKEAPVA
ncbi:MAG: hypothetical protein KKF39_07050 [Nanoarchaeota archaeon]|nr:hypothetical protein [Nanoarchaeota archaeon]